MNETEYWNPGIVLMIMIFLACGLMIFVNIIGNYLGIFISEIIGLFGIALIVGLGLAILPEDLEKASKEDKEMGIKQRRLKDNSKRQGYYDE